MNITFEPKQPVTQTEEKIIVNGECIGWCRDDFDEKRSWRYHVGITLGSEPAGTLIQGFGMTREEAITNAIERGRQKALADINDITLLYQGVHPMNGTAANDIEIQATILELKLRREKLSLQINRLIDERTDINMEIERLT